MKTLESTTIGLELPSPSSFTFQRMFSVCDHFCGTPVSSEIPVPRGPRHCSQSSAAASGDTGIIQMQSATAITIVGVRAKPRA